MNVVFIGTSKFACPALLAVAELHHVHLVVTQPDRPVGRHATLTPPPVKLEAERLDCEVFQPERINRDEAVARLAEVSADAFVVAAYGSTCRGSARSTSTHHCCLPIAARRPCIGRSFVEKQRPASRRS